MRSFCVSALLAALAARLAATLAVISVAPQEQSALQVGHATRGRSSPDRQNGQIVGNATNVGNATKGNNGAKNGGHNGQKEGDGHAPERRFSRVKPLLRVAGNISRWGHPVNLAEEHSFHKQLGGSFSLMCTLRLEKLSPWQRIFDFSFKADIDSITAGSIDNTSHLHFTVFRGKSQKSVHVADFFELKKRVTTLFTVSKDGRMRVWKDGELSGEIEGFAPYFNDRPNLMIGGHYAYKKQFFHGVVGNVKIWNKEVIWPPRPGVKPVNLKKQPVLAHMWGNVMGRLTAQGPPMEHAEEQTTTTTSRDTFAETMQKRIAASAEAANKRRNRQQQMMLGLPDGQIAGPPLPKPPPMHMDDFLPSTSTEAARMPEPPKESHTLITMVNTTAAVKPAGDRSGSTRSRVDLLWAFIAAASAACTAS